MVYEKITVYPPTTEAPTSMDATNVSMTTVAPKIIGES